MTHVQVYFKDDTPDCELTGPVKIEVRDGKIRLTFPNRIPPLPMTVKYKIEQIAYLTVGSD